LIGYLNEQRIYLKLPPMAGAPTTFVAACLLAAAVGGLPVTDAAMREETDHLMTAVSALRRLPVAGGLERHLVTREQARGQIAAAVTAALVGSDMATEEGIFQCLGLLPAGGDYAALMAESISAAPAGYYDPGTGRLYVPDWIPLERQRAALAHELAHALADRRFGLRRTLDIGEDGHHHLDGDAERARAALVEGDATTVALELADPPGGFLGTRELPAVAERLRAEALAGPPAGDGQGWLRALAAFSHVDGFLFVARVRARASWSAVDALWADPPRSTEQVLHPEKYVVHEPAIRIEAAPLPALDGVAHAAGSDVLGELTVRTWLAAAVPAEVAARAAAGWGGDRAVLYLGSGDPQARILAWLTVWDDPSEADDFARAATVALDSMAKAGTVYALERRGDAVGLLLGAPESARPALDQMLVGWRRVPLVSPPRRRSRAANGAGAQ
jgi:hypothetical protein